MNNDYHIDWSKWEINQEGRGTKVHPMVALALTPIIGLAFLMFLPFIGFYLVASALTQKVISVIKPAVNDAMISPPVPGAAYLTGNEPSGTPESDKVLDELHKEVQTLRSKQ